MQELHSKVQIGIMEDPKRAVSNYQYQKINHIVMCQEHEMQLGIVTNIS